jgi:hypothetical protein
MTQAETDVYCIFHGQKCFSILQYSVFMRHMAVPTHVHIDVGEMYAAVARNREVII